MSQIAVDAARHEHVAFFLLVLYQMVEIGARVHHGYCAGGLTYEQHCGAEDQPWRVQRGGESEGVGVGGWEVVVVDEAFEEGEAMGDVVGFSVAGEEEGGDGGCGRVGERGGVEFEKVEEGEEEEEEWEAPEGGAGGEVDGCEE